ncbi:MAG TPA: response regulator transcription factor [Xanthobacteraceae bacterium]|nr:response regulator transcription factor [Xanthobacteraceae bacterium]
MIVLAADDYMLCSGLLRTVMSLYDDVCVTAANTIDEVLARMSELPEPDLVLLDTSMPGMEDIGALRPIADKFPGVPIIITSPTESRAQVIAAIHNGARGYIPLSATPSVLRHALPLIMSGEFYIPASALRAESGPMLPADDRPTPRKRQSANAGLTPRQREVAAMLADGKSNKEIARELEIFEGTVKLHVKSILRKLGVRNRTEAVLAAARAGYLPTGTLSRTPDSPPLQPDADDRQQPGDIPAAAMADLFRSRRRP